MPDLTIILVSVIIIQDSWSHIFPNPNIVFIFISISFLTVYFLLQFLIPTVLVPNLRANCLSLSLLLVHPVFVHIVQSYRFHSILLYIYSFPIISSWRVAFERALHKFAHIFTPLSSLLSLTFEILVTCFYLSSLLSSITILRSFMYTSFPVSEPRSHFSSSFSLSLSSNYQTGFLLY